MQVELLWRLPVFKGISMTLLQDIAQIMERRTFHIGGLLFQQGDEADAMFVLTSGSVRLVREMAVTPAFAAMHRLVRPPLPCCPCSGWHQLAPRCRQNTSTAFGSLDRFN